MVVPYSMLRFLCAVANSGMLVEPHFLPDDTPEITELVRPATADRLKRMMRQNAL